VPITGFNLLLFAFLWLKTKNKLKILLERTQGAVGAVIPTSPTKTESSNTKSQQSSQLEQELAPEPVRFQAKRLIHVLPPDQSVLLENEK